MTPTEYLRSHPLPDRNRWDHQVTAFNLSHERAHFFFSMEPRTGKTQPTLDTAAYQYLLQQINGLIVVAMPGGAPRNWADEINAGMLPGIPTKIVLWDPTKAGKPKPKAGESKRTLKPKNLTYTSSLNDLLTFDGLSILLVNGESSITPNFCDFAHKFMLKRPTMFVGDETTLLMKTPGAARTKALYYLGKRAKMRRCLDGTPVGEGPLDLFAQYRFLSDDIFGTQFTLFQRRFCEVQTMRFGSGKPFIEVVKGEDGRPKFQNLDKLQRLITPHTFRVLFRDVFKDVPEPIYQKRYITLTDKQRGHYDQLVAEYEVDLAQGTITVANVLTRYLRLQQITSGFWPSSKSSAPCAECLGEGCETCDGLGLVITTAPLQRLIAPEDNPRLKAVRDELQISPCPTVHWARFNQDIDDLMQLLRDLGRRPVQYDGRVSPEQKHANKAAFQGGDASDFVGKTTSAGRAVSVSAAGNVIYYSNQFALLQRQQADLRPLTGTRRDAYGVVDIVAQDTKDEDIIASLRAKKSVVDYVMNEKGGKWI